MTTLIVAHRGASRAQPENTPAAMETAIAMGAEMVEFDIRALRDGKLVVHHGPMWRGVPLSRLDYAELQSPSVGRVLRRQPPPPLFEEILEVCAGRIRMDIELKERNCEAAVLNNTLRRVDRTQFIITSFIPSVVGTTKDIDGDVETGVLIARWNGLRVMQETVRECQADYVCPSDFIYRLALRLEKPMYVFTVNRMSRMTRLFDDDRVRGIITDMPDRALSLRAIHEGASL